MLECDKIDKELILIKQTHQKKVIFVITGIFWIKMSI